MQILQLQGNLFKQMTEKIQLQLLNGKVVDVTVNRKRIRNLYLKILPDTTIEVSSPLRTDFNEISKFLAQHKKWIEKNILKFKDNDTIKDNIVSGGVVSILGTKHIVFIYQSNTDKVIKDGFTICIYSRKFSDTAYVKKQYESFFYENALEYFKILIDKFYPEIQKYNIVKPMLKVKVLKSKWGSCVPKDKKITLNLLLYKTRPECVEYVVLHELTHLLFLGHSKQFYDFIEKIMPNYKTNEKMLDYEYSNILSDN